MKLESFYKLRTEFVVIGLTGRVGGGCSMVANKLTDAGFAQGLKSPDLNNLQPEAVKYKICQTYLSYDKNWLPYTVIVYKDVILLHLLYYSLKGQQTGNFNQLFIDVLTQNGTSIRKEYRNRYDYNDGADRAFLDSTLADFLNRESTYLNRLKARFDAIDESNLNAFLKADLDFGHELFFTEDFKNFSKTFYGLLEQHNVIKRTRLIHDVANNLRMTGSVLTKDGYDYQTEGLQHIYTNAETINRLIKSYRKKAVNGTRIVIDALKNSLELMYFKEKYSAFYMVAVNRQDDRRRGHVHDTIHKTMAITDDPDGKVNNIMSFDADEYKANDFKSGKFASPDVENCIQKSDYHIYIDHSRELPAEEYKADKNMVYSPYFSIDYQLLKLLSLISQPGIITPSTDEHFMQVAYNAKFNSGCISRQVGAVVTDDNYSIKAIGWNDVPEGQTPCSMRNINDLLSETPNHMFSEFERDGGYGSRGKFRNLVAQEIPADHNKNLDGRNCSFCFKSFHNAFEDDKNQVHTRSLHAEENAMMQITKFGGQGILGGNLYTTASPCELCSKKAFQLGIRNIFYIDPYPGIAMTQILKAASTDDEANPNLIMFQGALGRAFHKLYEPFMAYKDELAILTGINPKPKLEERLSKIINDEQVLKAINEQFADNTEKTKEELLTAIIKKGLGS